MITNINKFQNIKEASKKTDGYDLLIIDVQKEQNIIDDDLKLLNKYCEDFARVFQFCDTTDNKKPTYTFKKQVKVYSKEYKELSIYDVPLLFHELQHQQIIDKIKNIPDDYEIFETIHNEYYVHLGFEKWLLLPSDVVSIFKSLKKQNRNVILVGNKKTTNDIYHIMYKLNINVEYNFEYIYNKQ